MKIAVRCPRVTCNAHDNPGAGDIIRRGYAVVIRRTAQIRQREPRFQCKLCGRYFKSSTHTATARQRYPELNKRIFEAYTAGNTINQMMRDFKVRQINKITGKWEYHQVTKRTILRRIPLIANMVWKYHIRAIEKGLIRTDHVQFDEMETYEVSHLSPLTMPLAIDVASGRILDIRLAPIKVHNAKLSTIASLHPNPFYSQRKNLSKLACRLVMETVRSALCPHKKVMLYTDRKRAYTTVIKTALKGCVFTHRPVRARWIKLLKEKSPIRSELSKTRCGQNAECHLFLSCLHWPTRMP